MISITPIAADSFGVRSMATFIETSSVRLLIDASAALAPKRYGLNPHPIEWQRLDECWREIVSFAASADVVILTHYHYDHHSIHHPEVFKDKRVFIKDPALNVNRSQMWRAAYFLQTIQGLPKEIKPADGKKLRIGETTINFSPAVTHGVDAKLGYVIEVSVKSGGESVLFTSDVQGPVSEEQVKFILENTPQTLIVDGPPTYLIGVSFTEDDLKIASQLLTKIIRSLVTSGLHTIILDHHLLRDLNYREKLKPVYEVGEELGVRLFTAAEFSGRNVDMLEARRKELYKKVQ
jgi:predicted metallo-beta-lactamase superfamily hydrolase